MEGGGPGILTPRPPGPQQIGSRPRPHRQAERGPGATPWEFVLTDKGPGVLREGPIFELGPKGLGAFHLRKGREEEVRLGT